MMSSFKRLEHNELNDVEKYNIILDTYYSFHSDDHAGSGHSPNMGKKTVERLKQVHYDALIRAKDIKTFSTNYDDYRIGHSKTEGFYFYYRESSPSLSMFDTPSRLVYCFFFRWRYHDALPFVLYSPLSLEDAKQEMLDFLK